MWWNKISFIFTLNKLFILVSKISNTIRILLKQRLLKQFKLFSFFFFTETPELRVFFFFFFSPRLPCWSLFSFSSFFWLHLCQFLVPSLQKFFPFSLSKCFCNLYGVNWLILEGYLGSTAFNKVVQTHYNHCIWLLFLPFCLQQMERS